MTAEAPLIRDQLNHAVNARVGSSGLFAAFDWFKQTDAEATASVTPVNYSYPPGHIYRYANPLTTTDWSSATQDAIDSATGAIYFPAGSYGFLTTVLIRSGTVQNLSIVGESRVNTIFKPLAASIAVPFRDANGDPGGAIPAENTNCIFFNQSNNGHAHWQSLRFGPDAVAYTGIAIYCKEGGGADASGQAAFSWRIVDCWFSFSSNNAGYLRGGFQNLQASELVFESSKTGCFILEGIGIGDLLFSDITLNACFDSFICASIDTQPKNLISVNGLHAYQHLRGVLFDFDNGLNVILNDIQLEPDAANFGSTGLFKFKDCKEVICTDFQCSTASGSPMANVGIEIIEDFIGKISDGNIRADVGLKFSGTGTVNFKMHDADLREAGSYAWQFATGTTSGKIYTHDNCFSDPQQYCFLNSSTGAFSWYSFDDEFLNAGLNGTATGRNINVDTSGEVRIVRPRIGHNNGSAAAAKYINAVGAGTLYISEPQIVGAPPTALSEGAQAILWDGVDSTMPGMPPFTPSAGGTATYTNQLGMWSLKNRVVSYYADYQILLIGTGSQTQVFGLPWTSNATVYGGGFVHFFAASASNVTEIGISVAPSSTVCALRSLLAAAAGTGNNNILQNGTRIIFSGSYMI